jgi:preprotein translocase subunit SecF
MQILKNPNYDIIGKAKFFTTLSAILVAGSVAYVLWPNALRYGVEFSGGTQLVAKFQSTPDVKKIRSDVETTSPGAVIQSYGEAKGNQVLIRVAGQSEGTMAGPVEAVRKALAAQYPENPVQGSSSDSDGQVILTFQSAPAIDRIKDVAEKESPGADTKVFGDASANQVRIDLKLTGPAEAILKTLAAQYSQNPVVEHSTEVVGPVVGAELRKKAIQLTLWGLAFQLIYIAWRFKGAMWGSAATIAVFHDVLITLGLLALFHYEITLNVIAALLTLVGYSVNDTIVIFDRVRENLRQRRKEPLAKIMNDSINQTLSRTIISNGTTFLAVLGLYIFGGEVLGGFGFAMTFGIVVGTYSTIFIASPIVIWWYRLSTQSAQAAKTTP